MLLLLACLSPSSVQEPLPTSDPSLPEGYRVADAEHLEGPFRNRLALADSPYLLQHADNPVDWREWGDAAFDQAKERDLPVFLSLGYAACHWCHVMAHESFQDPEIAAYINANFIPIKVDREERPDVDAVYLDAVVMLTGHGGWPASIFLTPERVPFYAGTYFPKEPSYGRPSFKQVLEQLVGIWSTERDRVAAVGAQVQAQLQAQAAAPSGDLPTVDMGEEVLAGMRKGWDRRDAGWGQSNKFPMASRVEAMLALSALRGDTTTLAMAQQVLDRMERGGLNDHLGGGFHRYTVDTQWAVPHFEKMLYDNGQLLRLYAQAHVLTGDPRYAQVARDTADYLIRDMQSPTGAFWASEDADSEGEEGIFYVWTPQQVREVLPEPQAFLVAYGVSQAGNFEDGATVLARAEGVDPQSPALLEDRASLYKDRLGRIPPATDTKLVVAWNGLAISGLAIAGRLLEEPQYVAAAQAAAQDVLAHQGPQGQLPRTLAAGAPAGVLDDYAFFAEGLLDLYEADPDPRWLLAAHATTLAMLREFSVEGGGLSHAPSSSALLSLRQDASDGAEPSGWGRAMLVLGRLQAYGAPGIEPERITQGFVAGAKLLDRAPASCSSLATAYAYYQQPSMEVVIAGDPQDPKLRLFVQAFSAALRPGVVLAVHDGSPELEPFQAFTAKTAAPDGPRAYVCVDKVCGLPTTELSAFVEQLNRGI